MPDITIQELRNMLAELAVRQEETRKILSEKFSETDAMFKETKDRFKDTDKKIKIGISRRCIPAFGQFMYLCWPI